MYSRQEIIYDALAVGDRKYHWCQPVCKNLLDTMKMDKGITENLLKRFGTVQQMTVTVAVSITAITIAQDITPSTSIAFSKKGTIEFRLFNSTLHAGKIKAYAQFCLAISAWSIESNDKVVFKSMSGYTAKKKVTLMYNILTNRLGLYGDEFKTCRLHMMKQLRENVNTEHVA